MSPQTDVEAVVADLVKLVHSAGVESRRKAVRPKALLDNCLKVMRMLYRVPCEWGPAEGPREQHTHLGEPWGSCPTW